MLSTLRTLFKMTRPVNIVIAVITLLVGYELLGANYPYFIMATSGKSVFCLGWIVQALGFAFAIGFANIQNDILDLESDKTNRPERPLVTGEVSVKTARLAWIIMVSLMLLCGITNTLLQNFGSIEIQLDKCDIVFQSDNLWRSFITATSPFWFFVLLGALLIAYNKWLKHIPLVKNMTVAFLCTTPLLFALQYFYNFLHPFPESIAHSIIPAIGFAFLLTTAREIYKDLEDEAGDSKAGIMTFPLFAGSKAANRLAGAIVLLTWLSLPIPVFFLGEQMLFLIITGITLTPLFAATLIFAHKKSYRQAQKLVKVAMFAGLVALIISSN
jgi:4-hydroxybenzoate polyprenyltransferase